VWIQVKYHRHAGDLYLTVRALFIRIFSFTKNYKTALPLSGFAASEESSLLKTFRLAE
jgi:hypothetical protein